MAWSRAFQKCIIFHFLDNYFFCTHFYYITGFCDKKFNVCKFANFLQILKVEHKSFLMMYHLSYLDIKHGISWFSSTPAGIGLKVAMTDHGVDIILCLIRAGHTVFWRTIVNRLIINIFKCRICSRLLL